MTRGAAWALLAALQLNCAIAARQDSEPVQVLERGTFVESEAPLPPPDSVRRNPVLLPDDWYVTRPGRSATGWYRLPFAMRAPIRPHTIYFPRNSASRISVFVNGQLLGSNLGYGNPGTRNWAPPLIFTLPPGYMHPGMNVIDVRVEAEPLFRQGLTRVYVAYGPVGRDLYEERYSMEITTLFMFGAAALVAGLLAFAFWLQERSEDTLLWYGVTAVAWATVSLPWLHGSFTPTAFATGPLAFIARYVYAPPLLVLCLRDARLRMPRLEQAVWAASLAGLLVVGLAGDAAEAIAITAWGGAYLAALVTLLVLISVRQQGRNWVSWMLAVAIVVVVLLTVHDLARWMQWIDYDAPTLAHFHIPVVLLAIGAHLVNRHFRAAEQVKVLAGERQRIMADMHDGIGSGLVGLLGSVQSRETTREEIEQRVQNVLQDLRLTVDALAPVEGDLGVVLGNVRHRMRAAIEKSGARLVWNVQPLPALDYLTPATVLAIERIVLEALTNALRHACARTVNVSAELSSDHTAVIVTVADNGAGMEANGSIGQGLRNMRARAHSIGARISIESSPAGGTRLQIVLPVSSERSLAGSNAGT